MIFKLILVVPSQLATNLTNPRKDPERTSLRAQSQLHQCHQFLLRNQKYLLKALVRILNHLCTTIQLSFVIWTLVNPIIIVPAMPHDKSIMSIYNAQEFIQNGLYYDSETKRQAMGRPRKVDFKRNKKDHEQVQYTILHSPVGLQESDWERVVAVFVMGEEFQFSGWPWPDPALLFSKGMS